MTFAYNIYIFTKININFKIDITCFALILSDYHMILCYPLIDLYITPCYLVILKIARRKDRIQHHIQIIVCD